MSEHQVYQNLCSKLRKGEIDSSYAAVELEEQLTPGQMADLLVDAFQRGWITPFNVGLNDDGDPV